MRQSLIAASAMAALALTATSAAAAEKFRADYTVSAIGIPVGKSSFSTTVGEDGTYTIEGTLRSSGVARLFAAINGSLVAQGSKSGDTVISRQFRAQYTEGKKSKSTTFTYGGGSITGAENNPKVKERGQWVPLQNADLRNAIDPIASTMVPAPSPRAVCGRTLRVFDGAMRLNVQLSYLRTVPFSTKGFKGDVVTCSGKYVPVSGYDAKKEDTIWMRDNGTMEVAFAPVGSTGYFAPVNATFKTRLATLRIRATRFEQLTP
ncbi:MAG: DUF3108 domain-containing protein [Pseudomonadota bacterium]